MESNCIEKINLNNYFSHSFHKEFEDICSRQLKYDHICQNLIENSKFDENYNCNNNLLNINKNNSFRKLEAFLIGSCSQLKTPKNTKALDTTVSSLLQFNNTVGNNNKNLYDSLKFYFNESSELKPKLFYNIKFNSHKESDSVFRENLNMSINIDKAKIPSPMFFFNKETIKIKSPKVSENRNLFSKKEMQIVNLIFSDFQKKDNPNSRLSLSQHEIIKEIPSTKSNFLIFFKQ